MDEMKEVLKQVALQGDESVQLLQNLQNCTEEQLADIWDEYERWRFEDDDVLQLKQIIINQIHNEFLYDSVLGMDKIIQHVQKDSYINLEDKAALWIILQLRTMGWVFVYEKEDEQFSLVVPEEIQEAYEYFIGSSELQNKSARIKELYKYLKALTRLYRIFDKEQFVVVWNEHHAEKLTLDELNVFLEEAQRRYKDFWCEGNDIIDYEIESHTDYITTKAHINSDKYYLPRKTEITLYQLHLYNAKSGYFRDLKSYLMKKLKNENAVEEMMYELGMDCLLDIQPGKVVELLKEYHLSFDTLKDFEKFSGLYTEWYNNIRLWVNRGFTAEELNKPKSFAIPFTMEQNILVKNKKVGRNDSCPCGSGKKYKHCCGK